MKKKIIIIAISIFLVGVLFFVIRGLNDLSQNSYRISHIKNKLEYDRMYTYSELGMVINPRVTIDEVKIREGSTILVKVSGPNISDELIEKYEEGNVEFFEGNLSDKIESLLQNAETETNTFELICYGEGLKQCIYTSEYLDAISGGLTSFYSYLEDELMRELKGE